MAFSRSSRDCLGTGLRIPCIPSLAGASRGNMFPVVSHWVSNLFEDQPDDVLIFSGGTCQPQSPPERAGQVVGDDPSTPGTDTHSLAPQSPSEEVNTGTGQDVEGEALAEPFQIRGLGRENPITGFETLDALDRSDTLDRLDRLDRLERPPLFVQIKNIKITNRYLLRTTQVRLPGAF